jgi:hypothetical protein
LPQSSVEAAVDDFLERVRLSGGRTGGFLPGERLGHMGHAYPVKSPVDSVVVLPGKVSVIDGVVRGLAQNQSLKLWARNVTVTATDRSGAKGEWRFPLTVQPGEPFPFEIENWTGTQTPGEINFAISADLSPRLDLTRALSLSKYENLGMRAGFHRYEYYPVEMGAYPYGTAIPEADGIHYFNDDYISWVQIAIRRSESTAHPRLAETARQQTIENLTVYAAITTQGVITDVRELTPMAHLHFGYEWPDGEWAEMRTIPTLFPPDPLLFDEAIVAIVGSDASWIWGGWIWAGSAAPDARSPRDEPQ